MQTAAAVVVVVAALLLPLSTLLLRLGCLATATADADTNRTTSGGNDTSCAPARCGNLSVTYPFSLAGVHPLECGYPAFGLTCDAAAGRTYLSRTFRVNLYRVLNISYGNRSMVVAVETAFSGDGACKIPDFNVSSGLGLFPVNISAANRDDLTFVYNCKIPHNEQLTGPCSKHGVGAYISERPADELQSTLPPQWVQANCTSASVPVRGFQDGMNLTRDYERLMSDGFVLDWPTLGDCDACKRKGGQCRFFELSFQCVNSSTSSRDSAICPHHMSAAPRSTAAQLHRKFAGCQLTFLNPNPICKFTRSKEETELEVNLNSCLVLYSQLDSYVPCLDNVPPEEKKVQRL